MDIFANLTPGTIDLTRAMAEDKQCTPASVVAFTGALALGTTLALLSKVLLSEIVTNSEGEPVNFHKPLFVTFCMFLGMALALPLHFVVHALTRARRCRRCGAACTRCSRSRQ